ncbi:MAG: DUF2914 domain-containing protein [Halomonadaceae bacterium]|nr:MAG: DUF2914 domain-containing protein [Halomonadaceae bacterium]
MFTRITLLLLVTARRFAWKGLLPIAAVLPLTLAAAAFAGDDSDDTKPAASGSNGNPITLHSEHITQAQLTPSLDNKAPTERLGQQIFMNERGLIRIYLFTEMEGLNTRRVFFDWYLEDERQARVTVRPHLDQMRASTSKFIDRNMLGNWEVRVVLADDTLLTSAHFEVLAHEETPGEQDEDEDKEVAEAVTQVLEVTPVSEDILSQQE